MKRFAAACLAAIFACAAQAWPFLPDPSSTVPLSVTGSAQTLTLPTGNSGPEGRRQFVFTNLGTQTVFFRCDGITATTSNAMPIGAGSAFVISLSNSVTACSVIASTTGSTLYATLGQGE